MTTRHYDFHHGITEKELDEVIAAFRRGECLAFPTETVYGLGADLFNEEAVGKIFQAKGRPGDNPLIAHIGQAEALKELTGPLPEKALKLMEAFWPGPLTLVLEKGEKVPLVATAGLPTIGVRMPDHPVIESILVKGGLILAAPSANLSGSPSPTEAAHVAWDLEGRIYGIIDGGPCQEGIESTILDLTCDPPVLLRPGTITREELEEEIGLIEMDPSLLGEEAAIPRAPGMKYRHYAPKARVTIIRGEESLEAIREEMRRLGTAGERAALVVFEEHIPHYKSLPVGHLMPLGGLFDLKHSIRNLYRILRDCDILETTDIFIEEVPETGLGFSYMNRLKKAAGHNFLKRSDES